MHQCEVGIMEEPKYLVTKEKGKTPQKLVQGSLQTSLTASPNGNSASSANGSTASQGNASGNTEFVRMRQGGVKVLTVSQGRNKGDKSVHFVDHGEEQSAVVEHPTKSVRTFTNANPRAVNMTRFVQQKRNKINNKILCNNVSVPAQVLKFHSEDLISEDSSNLALNSKCKRAAATVKSANTRQPRARYMDPKIKTTGVKQSASRQKTTTTRKPVTSTRSTLRSDNSMKKPSSATTSRGRQLQKNNTAASTSNIPPPSKTPVSAAKSKASQKTSTPNSKNKTFFEPDLSVVQPAPTKPTAKGDATLKGRPRKATSAKRNTCDVELSQSALDCAYAQYLRQRLIEKKIKEDYQQRHEKALGALSHLVLQNNDLEQEVVEIEKRVLALEYNEKVCEDVSSQHAVLTPIVKDLDIVVGQMQELGQSLDAVRHSLPMQDIVIPDRDKLQQGLARIEVNLEKLDPFVEMMDENGSGVCSKLAKMSKKTVKVCDESKEMAAMHDRVELQDMHVSNLEDQIKLQTAPQKA